MTTGKFRLMLLLTAMAALVFGAVTAFAGSLAYTFSTVPSSGSIQGPPASTIGWGYSITNDDSTDWLVTTNLAAGVFANGVPDSSPFDFPVLAPLTTVTLPYDLSTDTGLFALTWNATAPIGFTNTGDFTLSAQWWTGDPSVAGMFIQNASDETAAYSATVSSPSPVPESSSFLLLLTPMTLAFGWIVYRRVFGHRRPA